MSSKEPPPLKGDAPNSEIMMTPGVRKLAVRVCEEERAVFEIAVDGGSADSRLTRHPRDAGRAEPVADDAAFGGFDQALARRTAVG